MKNFKSILLGFVLAVFVLISLEFAFRAYDYLFKYARIAEKVEKGQMDLPFYVVNIQAFKSGTISYVPNLIWKYKKQKYKEYQFDSEGLRIDEGRSVSRKKPEGVYRIIVMGGSHPFGIAINFKETYSYQLERIFGNNLPAESREVEVVNAAVPGYSTFQVLNLLKYQMADYEPDLVIVDAGINDSLALAPDWHWKDSELIERLDPLTCRVLNLFSRSSFFWYYGKLIGKIKLLFFSAKDSNPE
ncbi:MAG: hypothetical protein GF375_00675, partial [Candidatus Omnitrophica bacterium]|nr:hypothetical protein [Candidatus Omnitrophota bacterium]MBD3268673.1 hypothetical protein [Candidatus Omnitrophota bacterium]